MPRWGMVIDLDKCVGCQACSVACKEENNVPARFAGRTEDGRERFTGTRSSPQPTADILR